MLKVLSRWWALLLCVGLVAGLAQALAAPGPLLLASLRVSIEGVSKAKGTLRVLLHDEATFSEPNAPPVRRNDIADIQGDVAVQFERLPPGAYAVIAFQDANNNGRWDMGEPIAVSNGAAQRDFDKAAIELMPGTAMLALHLH